MEIKKKVYKVKIFGDDYELSPITNKIRKKYSEMLSSEKVSEVENAVMNMLLDIGLPEEIYNELDDQQTSDLINLISNKKK